MRIKEALDSVLGQYSYDDKFYIALLQNNINFITETQEKKELFGGRLIGNRLLSYTYVDKNRFYQNLFDIDYELVEKAIEKITTIPRNFKVVRDDINLTTFYIAHRFLSNKELSKEHKLLYAKEALNYFNYRTLVLLISNYFIYPMSDERAIALIENLSNKYIIKKLKNWNEYAQYRSEEFLKSKFFNTLVNFNNDQEIINGIVDLFNRTKDNLKNIYREFILLNEKDESIKSTKAVINDLEGEEVIMDKVGNIESFFIQLESIFSDKTLLIKKSYINATCAIIESVSSKQLQEALEFLYEYINKSNKNYTEVITNLQDFLVNSIEYLQNRGVYLKKNPNVLEAVNYIVGNVLYARGTDIKINEIKDNTEKILKNVYQFNKRHASPRAIKNVRNAILIYILIRVLVD